MNENEQKILDVLKYYKEFNSFISPKTIYKKTKIKKSTIIKILTEMDGVNKYDYSVVGCGKSSGNVWKLS